MSDAATIAILRDITVLAFLAMGLGAAVYRWTRRLYPLNRWNYSGNVLSRVYELPDALLAVVITSLLVQALFADISSSPGTQTVVSAAATEGDQLGGLVAQIFFSLILSIALVSYLRFFRHLDPAEIFGVRNLSRGKVISFALAAIAPTVVVIGMVNVGVSHWLENVWPDTSPQEVVKTFETSGSVPVRILMAFTAVIIAPISEELLFRGFLYGVCKRYTDRHFAALITALLFAVVHMHIASFVPLFTLALVLVAVYEITGSLMVPIFMHALFNALMMVAMLIGKE